NPSDFGHHVKDRVLFYGGTRFRTNTSNSDTWRIRLAAADEVDGRFRAVYPMRWCFYDRGSSRRDVYSRRTLVDTGLTFKPGIVYRFAIAVDPETGRYDAAIRDDQEVVIRTGLAFANEPAEPARVIHF